MWWSVVVRGGPSGGPILYGKNTYKFFGGPIFWPFFGGPSKIQIKISHINYIHSFCDFKPSTATKTAWKQPTYLLGYYTP